MKFQLYVYTVENYNEMSMSSTSHMAKNSQEAESQEYDAFKWTGRRKSTFLLKMNPEVCRV